MFFKTNINFHFRRYLTTRVRFAPSPTGKLHLGGLRTALYNYLLSKKQNGKFILRIEDTDQKRLVPTAEKDLKDSLKWSGIEFDEGPGIGGEHGPYVQSERLEIYHEHSEKLIKEDKAYRCFCSIERLENVKEEMKKNGKVPGYDKLCRSLSKQQIEINLKNKIPFVVRFKNDETKIELYDNVYGIIKHNNNNEDFVLIKQDLYPTYHFANVIDDHLMRITHVLRGEEWINSLNKHIKLYKAFNWKIPEFYHLPLMLNQQGNKLSKRSGDVSVEFYKNSGYLPQALINFVALLGWTPMTKDLEILQLNQMIEEFELNNINKSNPMVFHDKLNWMNKNHLVLAIEDQNQRDKLLNDLIPLINERFKENVGSEYQFRLQEEYIKLVMIAMKGRIYFLKDIVESVPFLFFSPDYVKVLNDMDNPLAQFIKVEKNREIVVSILTSLTKELESNYNNIKPFSKDQIEIIFNKLIKDSKINKNKLMKILRLCSSANTMGPPVLDILCLLGAKDLSNRALTLLDLIKKL